MSAPDGAPGEPIKLSWDAASTTAPERPTFASSLAEETPLERPRAAIGALILVILATLGCIALIAAAALRFDVIQTALAAALPEDLVTDYSDEDIARAVRVLSAAVAGVWLALALVQLLGVIRLVKRSRGGRAALIVSTVLALPVGVLAFILREGEMPGLVGTAAVLVASLGAVLLACTPAVSAWLSQRERQAARSMVTADAEQRVRDQQDVVGTRDADIRRDR